MAERNSHQDALDEDQFQQIWDAARELPEIDSRYGVESEFAIVAAGRLGLRKGEIVHVRKSWVDWDRHMIKIPAHESCDCGYCWKAARRAARHNDRDAEYWIDRYWKPKTDHAVRAITYDFDPAVKEAVDRFFFRFDAFPVSASGVNRRVNRAAEVAGMDPERRYPHCLRASAATFHAYEGLPAIALQSYLGWRDMSIAQKYLRLTGQATQEAMHDAHGVE